MEILIATSIFAVICVGLIQVTQTFGKSASKAIATSASQDDIAQVFISLRKELALARELDWPPLKINEQRLEIESVNSEKVRYQFAQGILSKISEDRQMKLIQGLENLSFYRHDSKLLEIKLETGDKVLQTKVYLPNLRGF